MPIRNLTLLALVAALSLGLIACGGDDGGGSDADPQQVLDATFSSDGKAKIESADVDIRFEANIEGQDSGELSATVSGPVDAKGDEFPKFDLTASASGSGGGQSLDFEGGLTSTGDAGFVNYGGTDYEVDAATFSYIKTAYESGAKQQEEQQTDTTGIAAIKDALTNVTNEGTEDVEGTETVHVSGEVDVPKLIDGIRPLVQSAGRLGPGAGLPTPSELNQVSGLIRSATFDVYSGTDDDILRRFDLDLQLDDPSGSGTAEITFEIILADVNGDFSIEAPADAQPLSDLLGQFGLGGLGGLGGLSPGGTTPPPSSGNVDPNAFLDCINKAKTAADLEQCSAEAQ